MHRKKLSCLEEWLLSKDRKPMVLRGARQVGKTWLVQQLAKKTNKTLIEINFEKNPAYLELFKTNDVSQILSNLELAVNKDISTAHSILFIDEIQVAPEILTKLRWFYEDMPEWPVIAAGSLLEFVLDEDNLSMPVGRINYLHLEPMTFEEFLLATGNKPLFKYIQTFNLEDEIMNTVHTKLITLFKEYLIVGGMPESVLSWSQNKSFTKVSQIQNELLSTYRDEFLKYKGRIETDKLDRAFMAIPKNLGQKIKYRHLLNDGTQTKTIRKILDLLGKARICHKVNANAASGVPLLANKKDNIFKEIFLDVGLCSAALGLNLKYINSIADITLINQGGLSEQVTGQILRTINEPYIEPKLHYWFRDEKTSHAEIDYIIQYGHTIVPIEVKSGSHGTMKSLHMFMALKQLDIAIRVYSGLPDLHEIKLKTALNKKADYRLLSIPFYLVEQTHRILENYLG